MNVPLIDEMNDCLVVELYLSIAIGGVYTLAVVKKGLVLRWDPEAGTDCSRNLVQIGNMRRMNQ